MKKLQLTFLDGAAKRHSWVAVTAHEDLSAEQVREAMDRMVALHLFEKDGVPLFKEPVTAKYVETIETVLF